MVFGIGNMIELWGCWIPSTVNDRYILILCRLSLSTFIYPTHPTCFSQFLDHNISSSSYHHPISIITHSLTSLFIPAAPDILSHCGMSSALHQPYSAASIFFTAWSSCLIRNSMPPFSHPLLPSYIDGPSIKTFSPPISLPVWFFCLLS